MAVNFSFLEKAVQYSQNLVLSQLDRIYPINPYTQKREIYCDPLWVLSYILGDIKSDDDLTECSKDNKVKWHTWKQPGSDQLFRIEALPSRPTDEALKEHSKRLNSLYFSDHKHDTFTNFFNHLFGIANPYSQRITYLKEEEAKHDQMWEDYKRLSKEWEQSYQREDHATFHTVAHNVFDKIRTYVDQVAQDSGATHYQFDYQFKILEDTQKLAYTKRGGKIHIGRHYLELKDESSIKSYEFLSLEEKIAASLAHEFAHHCLGHLQIDVKRLTVAILFSFSLFCSFYLLALDRACKSIAIISLSYKLFDCLIMPYILTFFQRQRERDADAYSVELLYQSGFDIRSTQYVMQSFIELFEKEQDNYWWSTSTHPSHAERLKNVTEIVESYYEKYGHYKKP